VKRKINGGVIVAGGLGNQLFQFAAAQYFFPGSPTLLNTHNLARKSMNGEIEIESFIFDIPPQITEIDHGSKILYKAENFFIRQSSKKTSNIINHSIEIAATVLFSVINKSVQTININNGIGYDSRMVRRSSNARFFGYFQHDFYISQKTIFDNFMSMNIKNPSALYRDLNAKMELEQPIIIHVRLGDYKLENSFGIPSERYFAEALQEIRKVSHRSNIWLFSDEPELAIQKLPNEILSDTFVVPVEGLTSAETLDLMRGGSGYLISNSTFSWWAAYLRHQREAVVMAPAPWFASSVDPINIIPNEWLRVPAFYGDKE